MLSTLALSPHLYHRAFLRGLDTLLGRMCGLSSLVGVPVRIQCEKMLRQCGGCWDTPKRWTKKSRTTFVAEFAQPPVACGWVGRPPPETPPFGDHLEDWPL
jgi:hypothetical protein